MGRSRKNNKRKRRTAVWIVAVLILIFLGAGIAAVFIMSGREYATIRLKDYYFKTYSGYNGRGSIELRFDEGRFNEKIQEALENYEKSLIKDKDIGEEDYRRLVTTLAVKAPPERSLSNGDTAVIRYACDFDLASRLNIRIEGREEEIKVSGLKEARKVTVSELFQDVELVLEGDSPKISVRVVNNSEDEFIRDVVFNPVELKDYYAIGDVVTVRAYFSDAECLKRMITVEKPSEECVKEYRIEDMNEYLSQASDIPREVLREACEAGKSAFSDANTWGVRVFIEAGLVPVYVNKQATFRWLEPSVSKMYFKTVKDSEAGKSGNHYNDLDIVYNCDMTQADGVTTSVRAVVRFSDLIKQPDGTIGYDFSSPSIVSASHIAGNITKVVVDYFADDYYIEEIPVN
ncbi:MAG: hypothetical protein IJR19_05580 [Lachnospiraceae bacterium]|nr:hypothetical protein [Lachnospiraceae bacterium]